MISYLGEYQGSRKDPESKFIRAVNSFINQSIGSERCELIIISDGCQITNRLYLESFSQISNITLIREQKSINTYPGELRQIGVERSKFEYITYLDTDDFFLKDRLLNCYNAIKISKYPFLLDVIYNIPLSAGQKRGVMISEFKSLGMDFIKLKVRWESGTFQFIHRKSIRASWKGSDKRGEDYNFASQVYRNYSLNPEDLKLEIDGYIICHHPTFGFDI